MKSKSIDFKKLFKCNCGCRFVVHEEFNRIIHDPSYRLWNRFIEHNNIPPSWLQPNNAKITVD